MEYKTFFFSFLEGGKFKNINMKKIDIDFYSYRPRLKVGLTWTTDLVPNVGDEITIKSKFISQLDKKYFPKWMKDCAMTFRVKKRVWNLDEKKYPWQDYDVRLELDWSEDELVKVQKYLDELKKEQGKKKEKKNFEPQTIFGNEM